jgi:hypothetical protein
MMDDQNSLLPVAVQRVIAEEAIYLRDFTGKQSTRATTRFVWALTRVAHVALEARTEDHEEKNLARGENQAAVGHLQSSASQNEVVRAPAPEKIATEIVSCWSDTLPPYESHSHSDGVRLRDMIVEALLRQGNAGDSSTPVPEEK